jgi:hypothetical protein
MNNILRMFSGEATKHERFWCAKHTKNKLNFYWYLPTMLKYITHIQDSKKYQIFVEDGGSLSVICDDVKYTSTAKNFVNYGGNGNTVIASINEIFDSYIRGSSSINVSISDEGTIVNFTQKMDYRSMPIACHKVELVEQELTEIFTYDQNIQMLLEKVKKYEERIESLEADCDDLRAQVMMADAE